MNQAGSVETAWPGPRQSGPQVMHNVDGPEGWAVLALLMSIAGALAAGVPLFKLLRDKPDPDTAPVAFLWQIVLLGWFLIFCLRAVFAPIFFVVLSSTERVSAAAPISAIGVIGTILIAVVVPIAVVGEGLKAAVAWRLLAAATILAVLSNLLLGVFMLASYSL